MKKYPKDDLQHCGFSGRVPTLVTDNGGCFMSRKFHDYASQHFNHVRIQYRTPTQLGLLERFHGSLKDEEVYWNLTTVRLMRVARWTRTRSATTGFARIGRFNRSAAGTLWYRPMSTWTDWR